MANVDTTVGTGQSLVARWSAVLAEFVEYTPDGTTIPESSWRRRHRNITLLVYAHVPLLLLLGLFEGTESLITGATVPSIPLWSIVLELGFVIAITTLARSEVLQRRARTALATLGLLSCSVVLVHFSGGFIEAHFHFFVGMAVVAIYEDWSPFAIGIGYVVFTHGVFGMINPGRVYNHEAAINNPWVWGLIHGVFVLALAVALMSLWYSTERSREEAQRQLEEARAKTDEIETLEQKQAEIERARAEAEEAKAEAEEVRAEAEARQQEVEELNEHLEAKADAYSAAMERAARGDLTVRLDAESRSDAMTQIAESFNEVMGETESAMQEIQSFAHDVEAASTEAADGSDEAAQSSEEVTESVRDIADGAGQQREMLETVTDEMTQLSATVEEVAASAETVAETARETAEVAEDGESTAQRAIGQARDVQEAIDSSVDNVETLEGQMAEIGEIVELIGDVAEQTNMLALNANIEAARAGNGANAGDGDGFAVVANEVKQLAEETQESAGEIEQLIGDTQAQMATTVEEARVAESSVEEAVAAVGEVLDAFSTVAENAEETNSGIQEIRDATDDQAASTEEAVSTLEEVAEISRSTATESDTAAEVATDQAGSMSTVTENVSSLRDRAQKLQAVLSSFEVGNSQSAPDRTDPA